MATRQESFMDEFGPGLVLISACALGIYAVLASEADSRVRSIDNFFTTQNLTLFGQAIIWLLLVVSFIVALFFSNEKKVSKGNRKELYILKKKNVPIPHLLTYI